MTEEDRRAVLAAEEAQERIHGDRNGTYWFRTGAEWMDKRRSDLISSLQSENRRLRNKQFQMACAILDARDFLVHDEYNEAYHAIYACANPGFDSTEPWSELEEIAAEALTDQPDDMLGSGFPDYVPVASTTYGRTYQPDDTVDVRRLESRILTHAYSGVTLRSDSGEEIHICNRDSGFEINYDGWYVANEMKPIRRLSEPDDRCPECGGQDQSIAYMLTGKMCPHEWHTGKKPPRYRTPEEFEAEEGRKIGKSCGVFWKRADDETAEWKLIHLGAMDSIPGSKHIVLAIEGYGPPPTDWRPTNEGEER